MTQTPVRTRMAPSPTGEMHVGSMAILLKNYAFAKKHGGAFVLRIEDTDQEREVPGAVERIMAVVKSYGLSWDEGPDVGGAAGPYVQSERLPVYATYANQLVSEGKAYHCFCTKERLERIREESRAKKQPPKYDKHCRSLPPGEIAQRLSDGESSVIRLAVPEDKEISFEDLIRGPITFNSSEVDDQVLLKSDGFPTYHLAVVVDDHLMGITHVMRGEEWISSTPKHILLYQAFNWETPVHAHIPVFLNPDGQGKMSKRKGAVSAQLFLDQGYLPEALLNFFMILGWGREDQQEIMTLAEYIELFDPKDVSPKSVVFDLQKLAWINGVYIRALEPRVLKERLKPFIPDSFPMEKLDAVLPLIFERLVKLSDFDELTRFFYIAEIPSIEDLLKKGDRELVIEQLEHTRSVFEGITEWNHSTVEAEIRSLQELKNWKKKQFFMMLRVACTGRPITPPLFETLQVVGKAEILKRVQVALALLTTT